MTTAAQRAVHRSGVLLAIVAAFGFSFKAILIKLAFPYGVDAVTLLVLRMAFALPVFAWVGLSASRSAPALSRRDWGMLIALGALGYYGASILDFIGLQYISAGLERLILFTYPTLTLLIGLAFYQRPVRAAQWWAIGLCYLGIALAFFHDLRISGDWSVVLTGAGFVFGSAICYAVYLSGSGPMIARLGTARFTALAMLVSTSATFVHFLLARPLSALAQPWPVYGYGLAMALLCTVLPVFAQSAAIRRVGSGDASLIGMIGPMLTVVFAAVLLDEQISLEQMAGMALVLAGVALISRRPKNAEGLQ